MAKYLLDTNACIGIRNHLKGNASKDPARRAAQAKLIARWQAMPAAELAMSLFTLGELRVYVQRFTDTTQRANANALLDQVIAKISVIDQPGTDAHAGDTHALAHHYGDIRAGLELANDLWIAAHARVHRLTVVTNNLSDFARVPGLATEDWTV